MAPKSVTFVDDFPSGHGLRQQMKNESGIYQKNLVRMDCVLYSEAAQATSVTQTE